MRSQGRQPKRRRTPRGSTYVLVLVVSMMVTVIGLSAAMVGRMSLRTAQGTDDWAEAQRLASSGLEHALLHIEESVATAEGLGTNWRDGYLDGNKVADLPLGNGRFFWQLEDTTGDKDLRNDPAQSLFVIATGQVNDASYTLRLRMDPGPDPATPLSCLETALQAGDAITLTSATIDTDQIMSTNSFVTASAAQVKTDVEAVGSITGATYLGSTSLGAAPRQMPDGSVFDEYLARATRIDISDLPTFFGRKYLIRVVLSPANNPYGPENPEGIYAIDCKGQELRVTWSRIVGTLVVLNPGPGSSIPHQEINWEPAYPDYPALLVDGDLTIQSGSANPLDEGNAGSYSINFNPPGTPYQGQTDGSLSTESSQRWAAQWGETNSPSVHDDVYPSVIAGLIYVSGDLTVPGHEPVIEGVLVVGGQFIADPGSTVTLLYRDAFLEDPPPGFQVLSGPPRVVAGTVAQVVK